MDVVLQYVDQMGHGCTSATPLLLDVPGGSKQLIFHLRLLRSFASSSSSLLLNFSAVLVPQRGNYGASYADNT